MVNLDWCWITWWEGFSCAMVYLSKSSLQKQLYCISFIAQVFLPLIHHLCSEYIELGAVPPFPVDLITCLTPWNTDAAYITKCLWYLQYNVYIIAISELFRGDFICIFVTVYRTKWKQSYLCHIECKWCITVSFSTPTKYFLHWTLQCRLALYFLHALF